MARKAAVTKKVEAPKDKKRPKKGTSPNNPSRGITPGTQSIGERVPLPEAQSVGPHPEVPARKPRRAKLPVPMSEPQQRRELVPLEITPLPQPITQAEAFEELVRRASQGNETCLQGLREVLDQQPELWKTVGNVGAIAERAWVELLSGGNKLLEESIPRHLKELKSQLKGSSPTALESLLIDYLGVTWLAAHQGEIGAAQVGGSPELNRVRLRRAESAQKRFTAAVKTLSLVRALLPNGMRQREVGG